MRAVIAVIAVAKIVANPPIPDLSLPRKDKSRFSGGLAIVFSPCLKRLSGMGISPDRVAQGERFLKGNS